MIGFVLISIQFLLIVGFINGIIAVVKSEPDNPIYEYVWAFLFTQLFALVFNMILTWYVLSS